MDNIRNLRPLVNKSSFERLELRRVIQALSLANDKLVQRINVHELVIASFLLSAWFSFELLLLLHVLGNIFFLRLVN